MSQPPYSFGPSNDPGQQPPVDPYQPSGPTAYLEPHYPDPAYHDPHQQPASGAPLNVGYQPAPPYQAGPGYPGQQPYPAQPYSPGPSYPGQPQPAYPDPQYPDPQHPGQPAYPDQPQAYPGQPTYPAAPQGYPGQQPGFPGQPGYPGQPGHPGYQPQQPKSSKSGIIVAVVALLLVVVVGGGIGLAFAFHGSKKTPPVAQGDTHSGDLRRYLLSLPSDAEKCKDEGGTNETLSLDQAAQLSDDASARKTELQRYGYKTGATRCWVTSDSTTVEIRLYQFGSVDNASTFFNSDVEATGKGYSPDETSDVPGVPGGKSFASPDADSQGFVQALGLGVNGDVVLVIATDQPAPLTITSTSDLLEQEYKKL